jgi:hypothetical protein
MRRAGTARRWSAPVKGLAAILPLLINKGDAGMPTRGPNRDYALTSVTDNDYDE